MLVATDIHPAIFFPLFRKVTFPAAENVALIVVDVPLITVLLSA